jgi:hypothetical protein
MVVSFNLLRRQFAYSVSKAFFEFLLLGLFNGFRAFDVIESVFAVHIIINGGVRDLTEDSEC